MDRLSLFFYKETRKIFRLSFIKDNEQIGLVRFSPALQDKDYAYLHSVDVMNKYRNNNIGSNLLFKMDEFLVNNTATKIINGVLWNDNSNQYLNSFFTKNGYTINEKDHCFFDDGEAFFDIYPLSKKLYVP